MGKTTERHWERGGGEGESSPVQIVSSQPDHTCTLCLECVWYCIADPTPHPMPSHCPDHRLWSAVPSYDRINPLRNCWEPLSIINSVVASSLLVYSRLSSAAVNNIQQQRCFQGVIGKQCELLVACQELVTLTSLSSVPRFMINAWVFLRGREGKCWPFSSNFELGVIHVPLNSVH